MRRRGHYWKSEYLDLLARLTENAWLAFALVVAFILAAYAMGLWRSEVGLLLAVEVPLIASVAWVLSANKAFRFTAPFLWAVTLCLALGYLMPVGLLRPEISRHLLPIGLIAVFVHWLLKAFFGTRREFTERRMRESVAEAAAFVVTVWGATLQLSLILLVPMRTLLRDELSTSWLGNVLRSTLEAVQLSSPTAWVPVGFIFLGGALFAMARFSNQPYHPVDYDEVLGWSDAPHFVAPLVAVVRLPAWLTVVILGFVSHFVRLAWESMADFFRGWLGRLVLVGCGLVVPVVALLGGHIAVIEAMRLVGEHLATAEPHWGSSGLTFLGVHVWLITGLALYVVAVAPMTLPISPMSIQDAFVLVRRHFDDEGYPAAEAVGKAFVMFGLVIVAVPIASLLPGMRRGVFSLFYALLIVALVVSFVVGKRWSKARAEPSGGSPFRRMVAGMLPTSGPRRPADLVDDPPGLTKSKVGRSKREVVE